MSLPEKIESLTEKLPDAGGARHFFQQLSEKFPAEARKLFKNEGLLSDVLTLAAFSPFLAMTILQNPHYISWLERQRTSAKVRDKEEILESLARFALTNTNVETNVLLARFRRRELLRIYLQDIRGLGTIAEITEEVSNLADAILEYALQISRQELGNRYGAPLEINEKGRAKPAEFCIVALGKLGSKELNYASDIDLLFLYSSDGSTGGQGSRGAITNREYFVKLAEFVSKTIGGQSGEGAAYRVDLRLRPNGRAGALAISLAEAVNYYKNSAQSWERQVLIRSRACSGNAKIFQKFFQTVKSNVFSIDETVENALRNVRLSKEKINLEKITRKGFNVKLGRGGIREIEFIAQALQLAYAGADEWLRAPHTLISLARLADRKLLSEPDLTELSEAYRFLRCLEHRLQMENGLQIHIVPETEEKRLAAARRMNFDDLESFNRALQKHAKNVGKIFARVFGDEKNKDVFAEAEAIVGAPENSNIETRQQDSSPKNLPEEFNKSPKNQTLARLFSSLEKSDIKIEAGGKTFKMLETLSQVSPHFAEMLATNPSLIMGLPNIEGSFALKDFNKLFLSELQKTKDFAGELSILRKMWSPLLLEIVVFDVFGKISRQQAKQAQTKLAEASIEAAIFITKRQLERRFQIEIEYFPFAVLGLGKLGGAGMDYNSDLDLILVYDDEKKDEGGRMKNKESGAFDSSLTLPPSSLYFARAAEIFVTVLSALTRDGYLYRVDLRLRPDGKNGAGASGKTAFLNYVETRAAIWEWLAYVKLRAVAGDANLGCSIEGEARKIIHRNAQEAKIQDSGFKILKDETRRVRQRLEQEKSSSHKNKEIDIKFGAGGMLDVYFAMRFLQLRDNVPDAADNRSTAFMLGKLRENDSLSEEDFQNFSNGYEFLSEIDHNLRLAVGRSTRLPLANQNALQIIAQRIKLASAKDLLEQLTFHRLNIRASFEHILES